MLHRLDARRPKAALVGVVKGFHYFIAFDLDEWVTQGIRQLEDLLLVHAAFQAYLGERGEA